MDKEVLWRRIIVAKYGTTVQNWRFRTNNFNDMSVVWRGIIENAKDSKVAKWVGNESFRWEVIMVSQLMEAVSCIVLIPEVEDRLIWVHDKQGEFLVRKLSELLICAETAIFRFAFDRIWNLKVPPKVKSFLWMWVCPVRSWSGGKKFGSGGSFWCPPCFGGVKFNVSGVESEGDVGCGGVLRNSKGVVRAVFSGPCAARESSAAEVGAVCLELEVFIEMGWKGSCSLSIEVGSSNLFCWFENKCSRPWSMVSIFKDIESRVSIIGNVSFSRVDKHGNAMAFALAAAGLKRQKMFKAWW
ncbi:hypothetical protein PVK06_010176 [Gossypium arboreum]|uniref:RNase H type-1 domain-containing protein n=1 Tax=Gossypium arboreum TaxID=29729 RepID=A0ABR0QQX7_GOSAR|nr:hypothetical protein PVK06_010176 [Gossypium arboreum]